LAAVLTVAIATAAALLTPATALAGNEQIFVATGQPATFKVPTGITQVTFTVEGAQGGSQGGAAGAKVVSTVTTSQETVYELTVGSGGLYGFDYNFGAGFNGGGSGPAGFGSGGGGGASDVRAGTCAMGASCGLDAQIIVAAGGGGAEQCVSVDTGVGGRSGADGNTVTVQPHGVTNYGFGGSGAGQSAGGAGGAAGGGGGGPPANAGTTGKRGVGGDGGAGGFGATQPDGSERVGCGGGGGGGGFWGGGGGGGGGAPSAFAVTGGGGGGGSSLGPLGSAFTAGGGPVASSCDPNYGCIGANGEIIVDWGQASTTTALVATNTSPKTGEAVTYTATVTASNGAPTGSVTFKDGSSAIGACTAVAVGSGGTAQCQQSYGGAGVQHAITASYSGDSNFTTSTSNEVDVTAATPTVELQVSPSSYTFPNQTMGGVSIGVPFTVTNTGNTATTIGPDDQHQWGISGNNYLDFATTGGTCNQGTMLDANGGSCTIGIVFVPTNTGFRQAFLNIEASNAADNIEVPLSGTAVAPQITPKSGVGGSFPSQQVGRPGAPQTVTISNPGDGNLDIGTLSLAGANPTEFTIGGDLCSHHTIGPGGSCTVALSARPVSPGVKGVTLQIPNDAYTTQQGANAVLTGTINLTFNITASAPAIKLTPTAPTFGSQLVGTPSTGRLVTVSDTGTAPLHVGALQLAGADPGDFKASADTCSGATLAVNQSCTVQLGFEPTVAGAQSATLQVPSDALTTTATAGPATAALTGTGTLKHKLSVTTAGTGHGAVTGSGISCPGSCSDSYPDGTAVKLTAKPAPGSRFAGWGGACSGTGACQVTVAADNAVTATFTALPPPPVCTLVLGKPLPASKHGAPRIALIVRCNQAAQLTLTGHLSAVVSVRRRGQSHRKRTEFAILRHRFTIAAGQPRTITLTLPKRAGHLLVVGARESVRLTLVTSNANGSHSTVLRAPVTARPRRVSEDPGTVEAQRLRLRTTMVKRNVAGVRSAPAAFFAVTLNTW
jgi:hypothetical protein